MLESVINTVRKLVRGQFRHVPLQYFHASCGSGSAPVEVGVVCSSLDSSAQLDFVSTAISANSSDLIWLETHSIPGPEHIDNQKPQPSNVRHA